MSVRPLAFALSVLLAHDFYPPACCGGHDCRPVPCGSVSQVIDGSRRLWRIESPHAIGGFSYFSGDPEESPDANCHVCQVHPSSAVRCLFLPKETS